MTESLNLFQQSQRNLIIKVLNECKGNLSEASKKIGIGRTTLYRLMKQYRVKIKRHTEVEVTQ